MKYVLFIYIYVKYFSYFFRMVVLQYKLWHADDANDVTGNITEPITY